ncbi:MAG: hypothetical protein U1F77_06025 [Kiritimatiellia bacterium]
MSLRPAMAGATAALTLLLPVMVPARQVPVTIAYTAELRAAVDAPDLARLVARVERMREEERNLLVLDGGGWSAGAAEAAVEPALMPGIMTLLRPDVMVPGVPELAAGFTGLRNSEKQPFPWTVANLQTPDAAPGRPSTPPFRILPVDGIRVLVAGLTVDQPALWAPPEVFKGVKTSTAREALREWIPGVRAAEAEMRILVVHDSAAPGGPLAELAREFPDFDLVLGARRDDAVRPATDGGVMLAQPDARARSVVLASLVYDTVRRAVIRREVDIEPVREFFPADPKAAGLITSARGRTASRLDARIEPPTLAGAAEALRTRLNLDACVLAPRPAKGDPATLRGLHAHLPLGQRLALVSLPVSALKDALAQSEGGPLLLAGLSLEGGGSPVLRLADGSAPIARHRLRVGIEESLLASRGGECRVFRDIAADVSARLEWSAPLHEILAPPKGGKP